MNVAIVHYHARRGGVTRVAERAVESLGPRARCLLFAGEPAAPDQPAAPYVRTVPGLGYRRGPGTLDLPSAARAAFGCDPDVWHIHNHSLGKNPALTQEVIRLAETGRPLLLQIHDFAEDGRPEEYRRLGHLAARLYPVAPHIHYAALNRRDAGFLKSAGIPEKHLHLLPNPVPPLARARSRIPDSDPLLVYPCRAIRRKNIGELLLWSARMPDVRFAVTLAPENPAARPVYDNWVRFAEEQRLRVEFAAGARTPFPELIARASAMITTSIAEGFGLAFLEPWTAGIPLAGRDLPEITADFKQHGLDLSNLYDRLPVALDRDMDVSFLKALRSGLRAARSAYQRPWSETLVEEARAALIRDGAVDFGVLNEPLQQQIIRRIRHDPEWRATVAPATAQAVDANRRIIAAAYDSAAYGDRLLAIYRSLAGQSAGAVDYADGTRILDAFLDPGRFTLLRT